MKETRDFNFKLNTDLINDVKEKDMPSSNEEMNKSIKIADEILEVFRNNSTNMLDALYILSALANSIYTYSFVDGGDINKEIKL